MPKKKSRSINSYEKPKTVKVAAPFPYKRVRIDWIDIITEGGWGCLLYTSPSPRDRQKSRMPSSA